MRAVLITAPGGPSVLQPGEVPDPVAGPGELVIDVVAAGLNRADVLQRRGAYPSPAGWPEWPGLEVSGIVSEVGPGVGVGAVGVPDGSGFGGAGGFGGFGALGGPGFAVGDRVCALLGGGGYAERVAVPAAQVLPVPDEIDLVDAAGLPEVVATVWANVFLLAGLRAGETLLVHGGSSGIGTMAVQLGRAFGARVAVTARSAEKLEACRELGADILIDYTTSDFAERMRAEGGADVILDVVGADYLERNIDALATNGRIVTIANLAGGPATIDLNALMAKRGSLSATSLRARPAEEKAAIIASVRENVWPLVENGTVRPVVAARFPLAEAGEAQRLMETSTHIGKILLTV